MLQISDSKLVFNIFFIESFASAYFTGISAQMQI